MLDSYVEANFGENGACYDGACLIKKWSLFNKYKLQLQGTHIKLKPNKVC